MPSDLTRPIIGIENRTAQEVFDIMCDRFRMSEAESESLSRTGAVKVTEAMVEAGLEYYAEGGCGGLADYERREVVEAIIEAALKAAMEAGCHE